MINAAAAAGVDATGASNPAPRPIPPLPAKFIAQQQSKDCKKTADAMARTAGANPTGTYQGIEIARTENKDGHITIDRAAAAEARNYVDNQLESGKPVVVGVNHSEPDEKYNTDKITDHFVLITGRGIDEQGRVYYTFKDPAGGTPDVGDDTNLNNRFIVDESGKMVRAGSKFGAGKYVAGSNFEVSLVVGNASLQKEVGKHGDPESGDSKLVREALKKAGQTPSDEGPWSKADRKALQDYQKAQGLVDDTGEPAYKNVAFDPAKQEGMAAVTFGWIVPGDATDRYLLGGAGGRAQPAPPAKEPAAKEPAQKPAENSGIQT